MKRLGIVFAVLPLLSYGAAESIVLGGVTSTYTIPNSAPYSGLTSFWLDLRIPGYTLPVNQCLNLAEVGNITQVRLCDQAASGGIISTAGGYTTPGGVPNLIAPPNIAIASASSTEPMVLTLANAPYPTSMSANSTITMAVIQPHGSFEERVWAEELFENEYALEGWRPGVSGSVNLNESAAQGAGQAPVWTQAPDYFGALASQSDPITGIFAEVYDNFTLASTSHITQVRWTGSYFTSAATITSFTLQFGADNNGKPGAPLASLVLQGNAGETFIQNDRQGFPVYSYAAPVDFTATAGTQYWFSIVPQLTSAYQWGWETSSGTGDPGDGICFQQFFGVLYSVPTDVAFELDGTGPPAAPVPISPTNGETSVPLTSTLSWGAVSGATSYSVYVGTTSPPSLVTSTSGTTYSAGLLTAGTTYYWQVAANNGTVSTDSAVWSFTTQPVCTYGINPNNASVGPAGGSGTAGVAAPAGCSWTATSNATWLTITAGGAGSGNGTVSYTAAANTGASSRSGTVTIAGQTLTVDQAGATALGMPTVVLETPANGAAVSGMIAVEGYALASNTGGGSITSVTVAVDGTTVGSAFYGVIRNDVCAEYVGSAGCPDVGFGFMLNGNTLASGSHTITVTATAGNSSGNTASTVSSTTLNVSTRMAVYYEIVNKNSGKVLDVFNDSTSDGALIQQWDYSGTANQQWQLVPVDNSGMYYEIVSENSGKVLDVFNDSTSNGAVIQQWDYSGTANQQWQLVPVDKSGNYEIVSKNSGKVLDVLDVSSLDGALIQQWDYWGGDNQKWQLVPINTQYYKIVNLNSGKVLDVVNDSSLDGALIQQWDYWGGLNQQWQLVAVDSTYYEIVNKNSGKVLDVVNDSSLDGALIQQWDYWGGPNQQWQLVAVDSTYYEIVNKNSGKVLDVVNDSSLDGALIQQWDYWGGPNQQWQLIPVQ
jgi:hypothetical protein